MRARLFLAASSLRRLVAVLPGLDGAQGLVGFDAERVAQLLGIGDFTVDVPALLLVAVAGGIEGA